MYTSGSNDGGNIIETGNVKDVFLRPQSEIAKQLILPKGSEIHNMTGKDVYALFSMEIQHLNIYLKYGARM